MPAHRAVLESENSSKADNARKNTAFPPVCKSVQKCADGQNKAQWTNQPPVLWQGLGHPNRHRLI